MPPPPLAAVLSAIVTFARVMGKAAYMPPPLRAVLPMIEDARIVAVEPL